MKKISAQTEITFFDRVTFLDKLLFTKHLAVMIKSGIPLGEAVETIASQTKNSAFRGMLLKILSRINNGQALAHALVKFPKIFDPFYINLIKIGEESGTLENNLEYLATQLKKNYDFQKKMQGALLYPEIVLMICFISGGSIALFVLPKLVDLFASLDAKLPLSTQILLFLANLMKTQGHVIVMGFVLFFLLFRAIIAIPRVKYYWHLFLLKLPVIGVFSQQIQLSYFCRNMGLMLKSGLPITTALVAQEGATTNLVFKKYVQLLSFTVEKGKTIADALSTKEFPHIPLLVGKMIGVGEKTGKLDESLLYLGDFYADEVESNSRNLSTVLEPVMLIVIGIVVAFVAFSIITPIYELTGSIHN